MAWIKQPLINAPKSDKYPWGPSPLSMKPAAAVCVVLPLMCIINIVFDTQIPGIE